PLSVTMRTPGNDFELAAGFLLTEGIAVRKRDIVRIEYCTDPGIAQEYNIVSAVLRPDVAFHADVLSRHFYMTSSCGVCGKTSLEAVRVAARHPIPPGGLRVDPETISSMPERLRQDQALFSETGGLHAAGLFDAHGKLLSLREDVGRHNAVDKVIGEAFLADRVPLSDRILAVSGRASFEIMQKSAVAGNRRVDEIVIVDKRGDRSRALQSLGKTASLTALEADVTDGAALHRILAGVDVAVNATLPAHNLRVMEACFEAGCSYVDSAGYSPPVAGEKSGVLEQLSLDPRWRDRDISAIVSMGSDPGISNVMARV